VEKRHWPVIALECSVLAIGLFALSLIRGVAPSLWIKSSNITDMDGGDCGIPLIVIDAGHGGMDGGAVGVKGVVEAPLNLAVAQLVEGGLRDRGYRVKMTREDENALGRDKQADMRTRRKIMREEGVTAIVSIHMNKFRDSSIKGPRAFYMRGSKRGEFLATQVLNSVCKAVEQPRRLAATGNYFVLRESIAPAVIIECGFLSNASDAKRLQDPVYQQKLANGIVEGIIVYLTSLLASGYE
jgi:N-acetylmuramoyl-L-alanine amidase